MLTLQNGIAYLQLLVPMIEYFNSFTKTHEYRALEKRLVF